MEQASSTATTRDKVIKRRHHQHTAPANRHICKRISVQSLVAALTSKLVLTCQLRVPTPAQLTTPGCDAAREYLIRSAQAVVALAAARPDLQVEVHVAPVSGTVSMSFVGCNLTNTYRHLHNVALSLTPVAATHRKGLLIVAVSESGWVEPWDELPLQARQLVQSVGQDYAATTQVLIPLPYALLSDDLQWLERSLSFEFIIR